MLRCTILLTPASRAALSSASVFRVAVSKVTRREGNLTQYVL